MQNGGIQPSPLLEEAPTALVTTGALNAPVVVSTGSSGYSGFILRCVYVHAAATALTWTVKRKSKATGNLGNATTQVFDSTGLCTAGFMTGTLPVSASGEFDLEFPLVANDLTITFQGTGATGSDTLTVYIERVRVMP